MIKAIQKFRKAVEAAPQCLRAQQRHQALTIPTLEAEATAAICDELSEADRETLLYLLNVINGDPLEEIDDSRMFQDS